MKLTRFHKRQYEILGAAKSLILSAGIEGFSLDQVAKTAELSRQNLLYYFPSKADLLSSLIKFAAKQAQATVSEFMSRDSGTLSPLEKLIAGNLRFAFKNPEDIELFLIFYQASLHDSKLRKLNRDIRSIGALRIQQALSQERSLYKRTDTELFSLAISCQSILTGFMIDWVVQSPSLSQKEYLKLATSIIQKYIN